MSVANVQITELALKSVLRFRNSTYGRNEKEGLAVVETENL